MGKLLLGAAAVVASFSLTAGVAAADSSIGTTGPGSYTKINTRHNVSTHVNNTNRLGVTVRNTQNAETGNVRVQHNTTAGDATTGDADNTNVANLSASVDNTASAAVADPTADCGCDNAMHSINNTGPDSTAVINDVHNVTTHLTNTNIVNVSNTSTQTAHSGNATVSGNTTGGSAMSGNASNTSNTTIDLSISN